MTRPIRVLHVVGSLGIGGIQSYLINTFRNIDKEKIQMDFVVHIKSNINYENEIRKMGGKIYYVDDSFRKHNIAKYMKFWKKFYQEHPEYEIVHGHLRSTAIIYLLLAKKYGKITIIHSHSTSNGKGIKSVMRYLMQVPLKYTIDYYFACSKDSAKWLYGNKIANSSNCYIANNAIDSNRYHYSKELRKKIRNELKLNDFIVLGQVGRLVLVKNHLYSLEVLKRCIEMSKKKYMLLIIGEGEERKAIEKKIHELKLEKNVMLLGNRNDVNNLMQAMDILLMPSLYEGLPMTLVEAQAASLHCIISDSITSGIIIKELVSEISLGDSIDKWVISIDRHYSEKRMDRRSEIIRAGFDVKENTKKLEEFYLTLYK